MTPRVALVNPGSQSNATGDNVSLQLSATSPGGTMSYSASGLPDGLSLNSSTGLLSGTVAADAATSTPYTVTVRASDGTSSSSQTFTWTVSAINLVSPGDPSNLDGDTVSLPLTTSYHGSGTLSYSATGLPPGLNIDPSSGQISGNIDNTADTNSPYQVTVTASDETDSASQTFNWTVSPRLSLDPIDPSNAVGDAVSLPVSASDAANGTLTYSAYGLPPGLTIDSSTGLISGTIAVGADASSPYNVTVTTSDGVASVSQSFAWVVTHLSLVNPGPQASADGQAVSLAVQGGDADGDAVTWMATGLPTGLSINGSTGLISGTIASNADTNSPYNVTVTVSDSVNSASQTFLWTVGPVALAVPADQTNTEGDSVSLQLQGVSDSDSLAYSASGLPDGLSLNPTTGLISGVIATGAAADGPYTTTVAVSNGTVSTSQQFTWTVNPVVSLTAPADQNNNEGDNVSLQVSASDALDAPLTYSADGLPSGLSINSTTGLISGTIAAGASSGDPYVVTVTASDGAYSTSQTFNWTVTHTDTTALTMTNPGTQTNVAGDNVPLAVTASDPDGDALIYSAAGLRDGLNIDPFTGQISGTVANDAARTTPYVVTVTASDGNGQSVSQTLDWLVNDPSITAQATPISAVEGNDTGPITVATFTTPDMSSQAGDFTATVDWGDGTTDTGTVSGGNGSFTVTDDHTYAEAGQYPVSVVLTDSIGNNTTAAGTATVTDAPLSMTGGFELGAIQQQSATLTLATFTDGNPNATASDFTAAIDWGDGSGPMPATVTDLGDGLFGVSGTYSYNLKGTYAVTVSVTDADGSKASAASTVVVGDIYAGLPSSLTVASFSDPDPDVQASDFTASINWGDGNTSQGTVAGGYGSFYVQGSHQYAMDSIDQPGGVYSVTVTVRGGEQNDTLTYGTQVTVVRPPLSLVVGSVEAKPGEAFSNMEVASFTEPDVSDTSVEFHAMIDWGDGTPPDTSATVVGSGGMFRVLGSHTYQTAGEYRIEVEVSQGWSTTLLAAMGAGMGLAVNPGGAAIDGKSVVPGNSEYKYVWSGLESFNFKEGDKPNVTLQFTTPGGGATNVAIPGPLRLTYINGVLSTASVNLVFKNQPATVIVQLKVGGKNVEGGATTINVVQVVVTSPTRLTGATAVRVNGKPAISVTFAKAGSPFLVGTPADNGEFTPTEKNVLMKSVKSSTKVIPVNSRQAGDAAGNQITTGRFFLQLPGLYWFATVTLNARDANALSWVRVGFIQHVTINKLEGDYDNGKVLKSPLEGDTMLDLGDDTSSPYYQSLGGYANGFSNATAPPGNSKTIGVQDTPSVDVPLTYQQLSAVQVKDPKVARNYLTYIEGAYSFLTEITATTDVNPSWSSTFWSEAFMNWAFNGSGKINPSLAWSNDGNAQVTAPDGWQPRTAPHEVDTSGAYGNQEIRQYNFE